MKSNIFKTVNSVLSFAEVSTNITGKMFFQGDGGEEHAGPTHLPDFAPSTSWGN